MSTCTEVDKNRFVAVSQTSYVCNARPALPFTLTNFATEDRFAYVILRLK